MSESSAAHTASRFANAILEGVPIVTMTLLLVLASYQIFIDRRLVMKREKDTQKFLAAVYVLTISTTAWAVVSALLMQAQIVKPGWALLIATGFVVAMAMIIAKIATVVGSTIFGPPAMFLVFYGFLFLALSGDGLGSSPTTITWVIMAAAGVAGILAVIYYRAIAVYARSVVRSLVVSYAFVYSLEFVLPYILDLFGKEFVVVRRLRVRFSFSPPLKHDLDSAARDVLGFDACASTIECAVRWSAIALMTIILSIFTYRLNRVKEQQEIEDDLHEALKAKAAKEARQQTQLSDASSSS